VPFWIGGIEPVDALGLAGTQGLVRVEAIDRGHQTLPTENLVAAGDAAERIKFANREVTVRVATDGEPKLMGVEEHGALGAVRPILEQDGQSLRLPKDKQ
jgi:hypothetical protein